jgi:hypothetical protein
VAAPALGALVAVAVRRALPVVADLRIDVAKVAHFEGDAVHALVTRRASGPSQDPVRK